MKLDLDKHIFEWTGFGRDNSERSCRDLNGKDFTERPCSDVRAPAQLVYEFQSQFPPLAYTQGTINRVTGELYAKMEADEADAKSFGGYRALSWTTYLMTCKNAKQQF
jgi:hypothetical protein